MYLASIIVILSALFITLTQGASPSNVGALTVCRRVKEGAETQQLVSLDNDTASGPAVSVGQELAYTGLKLSSASGAWAVVYDATGRLWKYPAADLVYCSTPGCTTKAGSSFYTEKGASCEQDTECCEGLTCVDREGAGVTLPEWGTAQPSRSFTVATDGLLPKFCAPPAGIACDSIIVTTGNETCITLQLKYDISLAALQVLNPRLECDNFGPLPAGINVCIRGNLTDYSCVDEQDWPAFLPFYEAGEQLDALVAARCGTLDSQDPAFAAPTLCCTGMPSASLASSIAAGFMDCNSPCVLNPTHLTGDSFSSWHWNPAERCWLQDTGTQHCGSLLAVQVNKANATANELYAAHLILRGLAATNATAAQLSAQFLEAMAAPGSSTFNDTLSKVEGAMRSQATLTFLQQLPASDPLALLQSSIEATTNRSAWCDLVTGQQLGSDTVACVCSASPYLYCRFVSATAQQAFYERAVREFLQELRAGTVGDPGALIRGRKALLNKRQLQQVIWGKECTQPPSYTGAHETILPFDLAPFDTECGAGYEYKCCIAYIPPPPAAAIAVECCLTASLCFVEVDVSGRLTSALKAFFATSPTATKPECLDTFLDREAAAVRDSVLSANAAIKITVCVKLPFGILIKKLVGTAAPKHVTEAVDRLIDAIDPRVCVAQVEIKVYLARGTVETKLKVGLDSIQYHTEDDLIGWLKAAILPQFQLVAHVEFNWVQWRPPVCALPVPALRSIVRCEPYCALPPSLGDSYKLSLSINLGFGHALWDVGAKYAMPCMGPGCEGQPKNCLDTLAVDKEGCTSKPGISPSPPPSPVSPPPSPVSPPSPPPTSDTKGTSDPRKLSLVQASSDACRSSHPCWVAPGGLRVVSDLGTADHSGAWDLVLSFVDPSTPCKDVGFDYNNAMDNGEGIDANDPNPGTFPASIPIQHTDETYTLFMAPTPGEQLLSIMTTDGCEFHYTVSCGAILGVGSQTLSDDCFDNDLPGQCGTLAVGTDLNGGVLSNCGDAGASECRLQPTKDVAACCAACGANTLCSAFTFRSTDSTCWLQDALGTTEQQNAGAYYSAKMARP